jgi:mannose-6-phosphate isomerase
MSDTDMQKQALFQQIAATLGQQGFTIAKEDPTRPWGGFFVDDEDQAQQFADTYFNGLSVDNLRISGKLSPKVLLVAPHQRLSWQYHHRRAEIWQVVQGPVGVATSDTDEQGEVKSYQVGERIVLKQGGPQRLGRAGRNLAAHRRQQPFRRRRHRARAGRFWALKPGSSHLRRLILYP